jgi:anti-sigma B factor antagonist
MKINQRSLSDVVWLIDVDGRLDQTTTPQLELEFNKALDAGRIRLVIDLSGVSYVNSGGLRCLITVWRRARENGGDVVLANLNDQISQLFSVVGFDTVFRILPDHEAAHKALKGD